jgi:Leucine-rich repeat (LRR) protein
VDAADKKPRKYQSYLLIYSSIIYFKVRKAINMRNNASSPSFFQQRENLITFSPPALQENTHSTSIASSGLPEHEMESSSSLKGSRDEEKLASMLPSLKKVKAEEAIFMKPVCLSSLIESVFNDPIILSTLIQFVDGVQSDEDKKPSLALTAINKEAFNLRFMSKHLRPFHFQGPQVERFLTYCQAYVKAHDGIRTHEHFYSIKSLSLNLVDEANIKQAASLLFYLPHLTQLNLTVTVNCRAMELAPLLEAAQALALKDLSIEVEKGSRSNIYEDFLPEALFKLTTLRQLTIKDFAIRRISEELGKLKNLTELHLLWLGIETLPGTIGQLTQLETLSLAGCRFDEIPEEIGELKNLLHLRLWNLALRSLPKSLGKLENLVFLYLAKIRGLTILPKEIGNLQKLTELELFNVEHLTALPSSIGQLTELKKLRLFGLPIYKIPEEIGNLHKLVSFSLEDIHLLEPLPDSLYQLPALSKLKFEGVSILTLSEALGGLTSLTSLKIIGVDIRTLPTSIGKLLNLRELVIDSGEIVSLPEEIGNLQALESLRLENLQITTLPDSIIQLKKLTVLNLFNLSEFLTFPTTINDGSRSTIEALKVSEEAKLLPDELCSLPALKVLSLYVLPKLQALPQEFLLKKNLKRFIEEVPIVHSGSYILGRGHFPPLVMKSRASIIFYQAILAVLGEKGEMYEEVGNVKIPIDVADLEKKGELYKDGNIKMSMDHLNLYWLAEYPTKDCAKSRMALTVKTRAQVDAIYRTAIANGGIPQEQPGKGYKTPNGTHRKIRSKEPTFDAFQKIYVTYLCDPDGGELAAIFWEAAAGEGVLGADE